MEATHAEYRGVEGISQRMLTLTLKFPEREQPSAKQLSSFDARIGN
jgi:hypothetical protein